MTFISESNDKISTKKPNPTDDEDITFFFFYDIVKQLILKRNDIGDSSVLSSWLKVLEQNKNRTVRNEYIKLMTLALQYPDPICPFKDPPPETIDPLENGVIEMARKFINEEGTATCIGDNDYDLEETYPTISTAMSNNKCQYASYQVIPNVGVQCYYAFSDEPMYNWTISSKITVPKSGPHATNIEWERTLAGIQLKLVTPSTNNSKLLNAQENVSAKDDVNEVKRSVSGNSRISRKKSDRLKKSEEYSNICNIMNIEQQNRNVAEEFVWNDASLLTGEMRLGTEECSDRKIDTQVKTQTELDKIAFNAYDKLYPGDFMINVVQSIIDDIIPMKTNVVTDTANKREEEKQQLMAQNGSGSDGGGCGVEMKNQRECPLPKLCTVRPCAGHGNIKPPQEERQAAVHEPPSDHQRQRLSKLIHRLPVLNVTDFRTGSYNHRVSSANCPTPADDHRVVFSGRRGRDGDDDFICNDTWSTDCCPKGQQSCEACPTPPTAVSRTTPKFVSLVQPYERSAAKNRGGDKLDEPPSDT